MKWPRTGVREHTPLGIRRERAGAALALLYDVTGDGEKALRWYQTFKRDLVAGWGNVWWITSATIEAWIERKEGEGHENETISPC